MTALEHAVSSAILIASLNGLAASLGTGLARLGAWLRRRRRACAAWCALGEPGHTGICLERPVPPCPPPCDPGPYRAPGHVAAATPIVETTLPLDAVVLDEIQRRAVLYGYCVVVHRPREDRVA